MSATIDTIIAAKGAAKNKQLAEYLKTCTDRQRAFLLFVSGNTIVTPKENALNEKQEERVRKSVQDQDTFYFYESLADHVRDLWLRFIVSREQAEKVLCYINAYISKWYESIENERMCNKLLEMTPKEKRREVGHELAARFDKVGLLTLIGDRISFNYLYDEANERIVMDAEDAKSMLDDANNVLTQVLKDLNTFEFVFRKIYDSPAVGSDARYLFPQLIWDLFSSYNEPDRWSFYNGREPKDALYPITSITDVGLDASTLLNLKNTLTAWSIF